MTLDALAIQGMIDSMDQEANSIRREILGMCWWMRGGLTYTEAMMLSSEERNIVGTIIRENIETTKKTRMPFF